MNITVNARHMDVTPAIRDYAEEKAGKFVKFFDNIQSVEIVLDTEAGQPTVEMVLTAAPRMTFVAHHREEDMYASIDQCVDKIIEQLRRHKEKLRDHKNTVPHPASQKTS